MHNEDSYGNYYHFHCFLFNRLRLQEFVQVRSGTQKTDSEIAARGFFYKSNALPVAQPTSVKALEESRTESSDGKGRVKPSL